MIDELMIQRINRFDKYFGTISKVFPNTNTIVIETKTDEWRVKVKDRKYKNIHLYHRNIRKNINKFHKQSIKNNLLFVYQFIYAHDGLMPIINKSRKENIIL